MTGTPIVIASEAKQSRCRRAVRTRRGGSSRPRRSSGSSRSCRPSAAEARNATLQAATSSGAAGTTERHRPGQLLPARRVAELGPGCPAPAAASSSARSPPSQGLMPTTRTPSSRRRTWRDERVNAINRRIARDCRRCSRARTARRQRPCVDVRPACAGPGPGRGARLRPTSPSTFRSRPAPPRQRASSILGDIAAPDRTRVADQQIGLGTFPGQNVDALAVGDRAENSAPRHRAAQ